MIAGAPFAIAVGVVGLSFGLVADEAGLGPVAAIAMSALTFAGGGQLAAIAVIAQGGSVATALLAAVLMNARYLPMAAAAAPSFPGRWPWRALQGQTIVDSSWVLAARGDGTFDRQLLFGSSLVQYVGWIAGTMVGTFGGDVLGDPAALGLDAVFPAFFAALLVAELRDRSLWAISATAALVTLMLVPLVPLGVPLLLAGLLSLAGLRERAASTAAGRA